MPAEVVAIKQAAVDRNQFLQSLVDNLSSRLFTTIAANKQGNLKHNKREFDDLTAQVIISIICLIRQSSNGLSLNNRKTYKYQCYKTAANNHQ